MNPSKVHDVHTRLGLYERGAMSAPFGYTGINGVYKGMTGTDESALAYGESGIEVLFLRQELAPEAPNVLVLGMFGYETFGPGRLFNPRAVSSGLHHQMIQSIQHDLELPNAFPQIAFGGRAPREL